MGNTQSTNGDEPSRTIIIDEWEIPESYKTVAVSEEVVDAVSNLVPKLPSPPKIIIDPQLSDELQKQRNLNETLKDELDKLTQFKSKPQPVWNAESREEMEEKKKAFDETVHRVKKQYFNQQKENVCGDIENKITRCLASNRATVLNCKPLQFEYQRCINEHRDKVLTEPAKKPLEDAKKP